MAFFDELKKNLSGVTGTVAKTSESVMKKSSTAIEIQKAKLKKVSLEGDMKSLYESLGQLYFEKYADEVNIREKTYIEISKVFNENKVEI